jgi:IS5 family transposase
VHRQGQGPWPYEFGVKVSLTTTNKRCKGGQFILHARALPGNPYDGHTLKDMLEETQALTDREIERVYIDKGYRGQNAPNPLRVYRSGQKRGAHGQVKRELRRRSAIAKQTATWVGTFSRAVSATPSTPS